MKFQFAFFAYPTLHPESVTADCGGGGAGHLRKCPPVKNSGGQKGQNDLLTKRTKWPPWPPEPLTGGTYVGTLPPAIRRHCPESTLSHMVTTHSTPRYRHRWTNNTVASIPSPPQCTCHVRRAWKACFGDFEQRPWTRLAAAQRPAAGGGGRGEGEDRGRVCLATARKMWPIFLSRVGSRSCPRRFTG